MSQEKTLKNLNDIGFSKFEAQIYLLLGKKGPLHARDIVNSLKINRQRLYEILKELEKKGLIHSTLERPAKFGAEPFEKILDLFVKSKMQEACRIKEDKNTILEDWQSISLSENTDQSPRFMVLEGRNFIYPRLEQMIRETKKELFLITNTAGLIRAEQNGLLKVAFQYSKKTKIAFKYLAEINDQNAKAMHQLLQKTKAQNNFEGRTPIGLHLTSRMLIKDDSEVAFFINRNNDEEIRDSDEICLWTNSNSIVKSFKFVFENLWLNSIEIQRKIFEIQKGIKSSTSPIQEATTAKTKLEKAITSAKKEIIITTSSQGLVKTWRDSILIRKAAKRGVTVKILTPITRDNIKVVIELSSYCQIKHIASSYLETTIIDGKKLFQFNDSVNKGNNSYEENPFEKTTFLNEQIIIEKTKNMLDEIWRNAISPGRVSVEDISKPPLPVKPPVGDDKYTVSLKRQPLPKNGYGS